MVKNIKKESFATTNILCRLPRGLCPKIPGKGTGDVALITEGILCKTCKELDIIIEIVVKYVHIFFKYPPEYSLSFNARRRKGRTGRILRKEFPHLKEFLLSIYGHQAATMVRWVMAVVSKYIETQDVHHAKNVAIGLEIKSGVRVNCSYTYTFF